MTDTPTGSTGWPSSPAPTATELEAASAGLAARLHHAARPGGRAGHAARPRRRQRRTRSIWARRPSSAAPSAPRPARSATPTASAATCATPNSPPRSTPRCRTRRRAPRSARPRRSPPSPRRKPSAGAPAARRAAATQVAVLHHGDDAHMTIAHPGFADPVRDSQATFRAVLDAMARPGTHPRGRRARTTRRRRSTAPPPPSCSPWSTPRRRSGSTRRPRRAASGSRFHCGAPLVAAAAGAASPWRSAPVALDRPLAGSDEAPESRRTLILQVPALGDGAALPPDRPRPCRARPTLAVDGLPPGFAACWAANRAPVSRAASTSSSAPATASPRCPAPSADRSDRLLNGLRRRQRRRARHRRRPCLARRRPPRRPGRAALDPRADRRTARPRRRPRHGARARSTTANSPRSPSSKPKAT